MEKSKWMRVIRLFSGCWDTMTGLNNLGVVAAVHVLTETLVPKQPSSGKARSHNILQLLYGHTFLKHGRSVGQIYIFLFYYFYNKII